MRALVQRVSWARVRVDDEVTGEIGPGLCVLVGVARHDDVATAVSLADKVWHLRIIDDGTGAMQRSVADTTRAVLIVSQFTLYGDLRRGRRPSWAAAARPDHAAPLVAAVVERLADLGATVATGRFGAHMRLALENDGPVTVLVEVEAPAAPRPTPPPG